jgi:hypothetical protein
LNNCAADLKIVSSNGFLFPLRQSHFHTLERI